MSEDFEDGTSFEFWILGVAISVVSLAGVLGNIICILMFQYKQLNMNQTFTSLLKWLAVIDSIFLVRNKNDKIIICSSREKLPHRAAVWSVLWLC